MAVPLADARVAHLVALKGGSKAARSAAWWVDWWDLEWVAPMAACWADRWAVKSATAPAAQKVVHWAAHSAVARVARMAEKSGDL